MTTGGSSTLAQQIHVAFGLDNEISITAVVDITLSLYKFEIHVALDSFHG